MPSLGPGRGRVRRAIDEPCVAYAASALPRDRRRCRRKEPRQAAPSWPMGRKEREGMERRGGMEPRARPGRAPRGLAPLDEDGRSQELSLGVSAPLEGKRAAPSSRLPAPGSQLPAPSSQLPAPGSQLPAPSSQLAAPSSRLPAPSSQLPAPSSQLPARGSRHPVKRCHPDSALQLDRGGLSHPADLDRPPPRPHQKQCPAIPIPCLEMPSS